jgi:predicted nucleic acid-binding protein
MQHSSEIIISDTSCLILLGKIDEIHLLRGLCEKVYITPTIQKEFGEELPDWIEIKAPENKRYQDMLEMDIDAGEASAIALSLEIDRAILIIDDLKGRKIAERLHLKYSGTLGLLLRAKQAGLLTALHPVVDKIRKTNFRFSEAVLDYLLEQAGE